MQISIKCVHFCSSNTLSLQCRPEGSLSIFAVSAWSNLYLKEVGRSYSAEAQILPLVQSLGAQEVLMQLKWAWQEDGSKQKFLPCSGVLNGIRALPSVLTQGSQLKYQNSTNSHHSHQ